MNGNPKPRALLRQILTGVAIAVVLFVFFFAAVYFYSRPVTEESGQRALLAQLRLDLWEYREQHGTYPLDLASIRVTKFSHGSSPTTLRQFRYTSDGTSFTVSCVGASTHQTITITSAAGQPPHRPPQSLNLGSLGRSTRIP